MRKVLQLLTAVCESCEYVLVHFIELKWTLCTGICLNGKIMFFFLPRMSLSFEILLTLALWSSGLCAPFKLNLNFFCFTYYEKKSSKIQSRWSEEAIEREYMITLCNKVRKYVHKHLKFKLQFPLLSSSSYN